MDAPAVNSRLNDLLVEIHRSLIMYVGEASPWSRSQTLPLKDAVRGATGLQQADVERLAKFLSRRGVRVDFGVYPHEYTSLHFVAIEYLAQQLVENQRALVKMLESAWTETAGDDEAQVLIGEITQTQRQALADLTAAVTSSQPELTWMK